MSTVKCPRCFHEFELPRRYGGERVTRDGRKECRRCGELVTMSRQGNKVRHACVKRPKREPRIDAEHDVCPLCGKYGALTASGLVRRHRSKDPLETACGGSGMYPYQPKRRAL